MSEKEISRAEFEKLRFCTRYWDDTGGNPKKRPYWDAVGSEYNGKRQRVFISALWFPTWEAFQPEAERALAAAVVEYDHFQDKYAKSGASYPISGEPHFLVEKITNWGRRDDLYVPWINALCPSREQFDVTLAEAQRKIEGMKSGISSPGFRVASLFEQQPPAPLYPTEWCCQSEAENAAADLLRKFGIR